MILSLRPKLLLFYGGTIVLVIVLFRWITLYGEQHLQAPPNLNGRYAFNIAPPAACPPSTQMVLNLQQSGIYLSGTLHVEASPLTVTEPPTEEKKQLTGRWQQEQVHLTGSTDIGAICSAARSSSAAQQAAIVSLQAQFSPAPTATLIGNLQIDQQTSLSFTAERQPGDKLAEQH